MNTQSKESSVFPARLTPWRKLRRRHNHGGAEVLARSSPRPRHTAKAPIKLLITAISPNGAGSYPRSAFFVRTEIENK